MKRWAALALLACAGCSQLLGLDEAEKRAGAGAGGVAGSAGAGVGGTAGSAAGGVGGTAGSAGGSAGGAGGASGNSTGGVSNAGAAGSAGAGAGGIAGAGGADTCTWSPLGAEWTQLPLNGSFENWIGTLPDGWTNQAVGSTAKYKKVEGCHGANGFGLSEFALAGPLHSSRFYLSTPSLGASSCWIVRAYGKLASGKVIGSSAGVELFVNDEPAAHLNLGSPADWHGEAAPFQVDTSISSLYLLIGMAADNASQETEFDFDNLELWYRDGACVN